MTDRGHGTVIHRMERYESFGVPEIDLWLAGSSHIFRRVSGVLDSGCFQTLLRPKTAALLSLPRLGKALPRRTVSGAIDVVPSRVMVRFQPAAAPAVVIPLPVGIMVYDVAPVLVSNRLRNVAAQNPTWNIHQWDLTS